LQLISRAGKLMKGTGRQSVLKQHRKLETITHGHRAAKMRRNLSGKRRHFRQNLPAPGRYHRLGPKGSHLGSH